MICLRCPAGRTSRLKRLEATRFRPRLTGFVAAAVSADSLGAALERAWAAREQWQDMGRQARAAALARYDANPGKSLLRILEDVSRTAAAGAPR